MSGIYEYRLIVLMENEKYNGFNQVILNEKQFKKVSDAILAEIHNDEEMRPGYEKVEININGDITLPADLFNGMESICDEK